MNLQPFFYSQAVVYVGSSTETHLAISPLSVEYQWLGSLHQKDLLSCSVLQSL